MIVCLCMYIYACYPHVCNGPHCETHKITITVNQGATLWKSVLPGPGISDNGSLRVSHMEIHELSTYRTESIYFRMGLGWSPGLLWWRVFKEFTEITVQNIFPSAVRALSGHFLRRCPSAVEGHCACTSQKASWRWAPVPSSGCWERELDRVWTWQYNTHPSSPPWSWLTQAIDHCT